MYLHRLGESASETAHCVNGASLPECRVPACRSTCALPAALHMPCCCPSAPRQHVLCSYGIAAYRLGNDFGYLKIRNRVAFATLEEQVGVSGFMQDPQGAQPALTACLARLSIAAPTCQL